MRIYFHNMLLPQYRNNIKEASDYGLDMLYHGLIREGHDVYSNIRMWWMYDSLSDEHKKNMPNKGFTIHGLLPGEPKLFVESNRYDLCIIAMHHSFISYFNGDVPIEFFQGFPKDITVVVDMWDRPYIQYKLLPYCKFYFKRELFHRETDQIKGISYAFPEEKIPLSIKKSSERENIIAPIIPVNSEMDENGIYRSTYIYEDEESYYSMYQNSILSLTSKKGGWETIRNYEIMANGSLPFFVDLEDCPLATLRTIPKKKLLNLKRIIDLDWNWTKIDYGTYWPHCGVIHKDKIISSIPQKLPKNIDDIQEEIIDYFKKNCLTKHLAERVVGISWNK